MPWIEKAGRTKRAMQDEKTRNRTPILERRNLTKHLRALVAVNGVNLKVRSGVHSISCPNGAGKTTLFNLLRGFLVPSEGHIFYRQKDRAIL